MLPPFCLTINGKIDLHIKYIDLILTLKEKSQSFSSQSRIVPWWTKPTALNNTSILFKVLTKSIAIDFVKQNIRCNSIAPGTVFSPSWQDRVNQSPDPVQAKKDFIARQPMGRIGTAEEIADFAIYLAGDESTFTTGQTFSVDGGISI